MSDTTGGPAFPRPVSGPTHEYSESGPQEGMSLRDYFAGQALVGLLACSIPGQEHIAANAAREAYVVADAMIAESERV